MTTARALFVLALACLAAVCSSSLRHDSFFSDGIKSSQQDRWVPGSNIPIIKGGRHRRHKIKDAAFWKRIHKLDLFVDPLITPAVIDFTTGKSAGKTGMLTMGAFRTKWVSAARSKGDESPFLMARKQNGRKQADSALHTSNFIRLLPSACSFFKNASFHPSSLFLPRRDSTATSLPPPSTPMAPAGARPLFPAPPLWWPAIRPSKCDGGTRFGTQSTCSLWTTPWGRRGCWECPWVSNLVLCGGLRCRQWW